MLARDLPEKEFLYGHKACPGCALGMVGRLTMKVLGDKSVVALPASCMSTTTTQYPSMNYTTPSLTTPFASAGAVISGIAAGFKAQGIDDVNVVAFCGDGGTADIGLQSLSGAVEQGQNFIYICYDNEAYMNTGIQKSGLTPFGAKTTTTPAGANIHGNIRPKKNMFEIAAAHDIPYAATASVGYIADFIAKAQKASQIQGTKYIHVIAPCPTGWGVAPDETVDIAREVVDCGLWYLAEYENGEFTLNHKPKDFTDVAAYLKKQGRFKHLTDEDIQEIIDSRDKKWEKINSTFKI
ncbi:MAG: pyruvate synthase subunit beta [Ruminococcus sp.]|nr:pyruvate synthase subunit beta [Ruminococcus sp.]